MLRQVVMPGLARSVSVMSLISVWLSVKNHKNSVPWGALADALPTASSKPVSSAW